MKFKEIFEEEVEKIGDRYVRYGTNSPASDESVKLAKKAELKTGIKPTVENDPPADFKIFRDKVEIFDPNQNRYVNVITGSEDPDELAQTALAKQDFKKDVLDARAILEKGVKATPQEKGILAALSKKYSKTKPSFIQDIAKSLINQKEEINTVKMRGQ